MYAIFVTLNVQQDKIAEFEDAMDEPTDVSRAILFAV